jgi:superfamily I DNA/RNA helicase/mRNA-degrading endonuclease RelE of RelBE toxin-antitoxin system
MATAVLFHQMMASPEFLRQLRGLPSRDVPLVLDKILVLLWDPRPDGVTKKHIKSSKKGVCRIRAGDYRILYTYGRGWFYLIAVDHRKVIYLGDVDRLVPSSDQVMSPLPADKLAELERLAHECASDEENEAEFAPVGAAQAPAAPQQQTNNDLLPRTLDETFLQDIRVPDEHIPALVSCQTLDDLVQAPVPEPIRLLVFDNLVKPDYDQVADGPQLVVESLDDLRRHAAGELVTFLLKLDPEQEQFVRWQLGGGPAILKGGPGTGKTVIALYRVREVLRQARKKGQPRPRILVTTYTNALVNAAQEMLKSLLGEADAALVEVRTVDNLVAEILRAAGSSARSADDGIVRDQVNKARQRLSGGSAEDRALSASIAHLTLDYICEEIDRVIIGRELDTLEAYLAEERRGRRVRLTAQQRRAIWRIKEVRQELMRGRNHPPTFAENRRLALDLVRAGRGPAPYDAVVIDEAQDLDPVAIRMLVALCKPAGDLLITADGNQSIYGAGFSWRRVHEDLRFRGRTGVLRKNYRSTKEIARAVASYLHGAEADEEIRAEQEAVRSGPAPALVRLASPALEADELVGWLRETARRQRVGLGCLAVLVPSNQIGESVARTLSNRGLPACFMPSQQVHLETGEVKVLTFHAAKGLEFPVVAVAGLYPGGDFLAPVEGVEQAEEKLLLKRRVLYVAMGRAMRELRVFVPARHPSSLLEGFDEQHWLVLEARHAHAAA